MDVNREPGLSRRHAQAIPVVPAQAGTHLSVEMLSACELKPRNRCFGPRFRRDDRIGRVRLHDGAPLRQAAMSLAKARARWLIVCFRAVSISPNVIAWPSGTKMGS